MEELAWRLQHLTNEKYGHGLERMGERVGDAFQRFGDPTNLRLDRLPWEDTVPAFSKNAQQLINQYSRPTKNPWDRPLP